MKKYYVYLVRCNDFSLYCGITTDLMRRFYEHNHSDKAAKYTRSRRPVTLVWWVEVENKSQALKEEIRIKKLKKSEKEKLIVK